MTQSQPGTLGSPRDASLEELLRFDGEDFVRAAYQRLLSRPALPAELSTWLVPMRNGHLTKLDVLAAIRDSREGRARGVHVRGFAIPRIASRLRRLPFVGYLVRWIQHAASLPDLARRLNAHEAALAAKHVADAGRADAIQRLDTAIRDDRERASAQQEAFARALREIREGKANRSLVQELDERLQSLAGFITSLRSELRKASVLPPVGAKDDEEVESFGAYYRRFEDHFRGSPEQIRERLGFYLPILKAVGEIAFGHAPARFVDIGSGRGEMIGMLREHGIDAYGVDNSEAMVAQCRDRGLAVVHADAIEHLASLDPASLAGITSIHVIEHLPYRSLMALFQQAFRVLCPGGVAIFETPNPENLIVGACNFYYDPTHMRPLPPEPTRFLLESCGFGRVAIERLHPGATLAQVDEAADPVAKLYSAIMLVPQDYALIAYKPAIPETA